MLINIPIGIKMKIVKSSKDFLLFNIDTEGIKIKDYKFTNDLVRYKNKYRFFRLTSLIQEQINNNKITI